MNKLVKVILFIVAVIAILYACSKRRIKNKYISVVKDNYFSEVTSSITIGEMLDTMCSKGEWSFKPSDTNQYVVYEGTCNGKTLRLSFLVYSFGGDMRFKVSSMTYGGNKLPDPDQNAGYALYDEYKRHN